MTQQQIEQAAIIWRGSSESAYTTEAFVAGAKWMQKNLIIEAAYILAKMGLSVHSEDFKKEMLNENKE